MVQNVRKGILLDTTEWVVVDGTYFDVLRFQIYFIPALRPFELKILVFPKWFLTYNSLILN